MEKFKQICHEPKVKKGLYIFGIVLITLVVFQAGVFLGIKKAGFSFRMGEQYYRQMNGRPDDGFMGMRRGDFGNSHGAVGKIVGINLPSVIVSDRDGIEKTILISTSTEVRKFRETVTTSDLSVGDFITVIGDPNDKSEVEAKLIRIMPIPTPSDANFGKMTPFGTSTNQ